MRIEQTTSESIARQVRERRRFHKLRQRDLAELAGVTLRSLIQLEGGKGNPTLKQLAKIADALGMVVTLGERATNADG